MTPRDFNMAIVGLGGVGGLIADSAFPYIRARDKNGWGLHRLRFIDHDAYAEKNISRQKAAGSMLGWNKATAWRDIFAASRWNRMFTTFDSKQEWVTTDTVEKLLGCFSEPFPTVVMACVDNHPARLVLSRWVQETLRDTKRCVVVIQGGCRTNFATADLYGRWPTEEDPGGAIEVGTPFETNHPELLTDTVGDRSHASCGDLANSPEGDQTYAENYMAASMMMNLLFTLLSERGPKTLSRHVGEVMEVTMHYHEITRRTPPGIPEEETENETKDQKCDGGENVDTAGAEDVSVHEETPDTVGEMVSDGVDQAEDSPGNDVGQDGGGHGDDVDREGDTPAGTADVDHDVRGTTA